MSDTNDENQRDEQLMKSLALAQAALVEALGEPSLRQVLVADLTSTSSSNFSALQPDVKRWMLSAARAMQGLGNDIRLTGEDAKNWAVGALVRQIPQKEADWTVHFTSNSRRCLPPFRCVPPRTPRTANKSKAQQ